MNKKGFTLIELLVVIAIIALLLAVILPSLRIAKDQAKKITCSANLKSLTMAALFYADEHDGLTPSSTNSFSDSIGRVYPGWCGRTADTSTREPLPVDEQIYGNSSDPASGLVRGQLWPYIETPDAWRCPADPTKGFLRSYCMAAEWWGKHYRDDIDSIHYDSGKPKIYKKFADAQSAGQRFVFVDQLGYNYDAYAAIWYSQPRWWNIPNYMHSGGSVNSFADGHVESYKMDIETIKMADEAFNSPNAALTGFMMPQIEMRDSEDLKYYQRATWGKQGW